MRFVDGIRVQQKNVSCPIAHRDCREILRFVIDKGDHAKTFLLEEIYSGDLERHNVFVPSAGIHEEEIVSEDDIMGSARTVERAKCVVPYQLRPSRIYAHDGLRLPLEPPDHLH